MYALAERLPPGCRRARYAVDESPLACLDCRHRQSVDIGLMGKVREAHQRVGHDSSRASTRSTSETSLSDSRLRHISVTCPMFPDDGGLTANAAQSRNL